MKIVFGIMSAVHSAATVEQLARALAPWPVVIHHDFHQTPEFEVNAPNVSFVRSPKRTGWAVWGFSEGIVHLLDACLNEHDADYFQLLSPTCLPVRPVDEFVDHLDSSRFDVHIGTVQIAHDPDLLMNFGYRAYCAKNSFGYRLLQRLRIIYFGRDSVRAEVANLQTHRRASRGKLTPLQYLAWVTTNLASHGWLGKHPFTSNDLKAVAGGTWFGCRRDAGQYLINRLQNERTTQFFSRMCIPDEMMFATLFSCSPFDVGESNHFVHVFDEHNPRWIESSDLRAVQKSRRFFGRKFRDDPQNEARQQTLKSIGHLPANGLLLNRSATVRRESGVTLS